jgi:sugar transferase (PEP-CTERM/EpsH1 system associated)
LARFELDAIVIYSSTMAQYVPEAFMSRTVVDLVDADSEKWREYASSSPLPISLLYALEFKRLRAYEEAIVARFGQTLMTTKREAALLECEQPSDASRLHVLPNGVDWRRFRPDAFVEPRNALPDSERRFLPDRRIPLLVFTGAMDYKANIDGVRYFVEEIFPSVRACDPNIQFLIVGSKPTRAVRRLAKQPGVVVTGEVRDVRPYIAAATLCVVPLRIARGLQNKVIEAMAMERAVVATPSAVAGLAARADEDVFVAHTAEEFAQSVLRLIGDQRLRERLGKNARRFVQREHNWEPTQRRLADLVESVSATAEPLCRNKSVGTM